MLILCGFRNRFFALGNGLMLVNDGISKTYYLGSA